MGQAASQMAKGEENFQFSTIPESTYFNETRINFMSFNIPIGGSDDWGDWWMFRLNMIAKMPLYHNLDIIAFQEPHENETKQIHEQIKEYFEYFGRGREMDGTSEYQPIFYRKSRFILKDKGVFWLSEFPETPGSKSWDTACTRQTVWIKLYDQKINSEFYVFNTHWDHRGAISRFQSGAVIRKKLNEINKQNLPIILAGDFNIDRDFAGMKLLKLRHPKDEFPMSSIFGPPETFIGWKREYQEVYDHILFEGLNITCVQYGVLIDDFKTGRVMSDHRPVFARFNWMIPDPSTSQRTTENSNEEEDEDVILAKALSLSLSNE